MKTTQIIQRQFYGKTIQQNHHTQFFGNAYRKSIGQEPTTLEKYTRSKKTQEFIHALMQKEKIGIDDWNKANEEQLKTRDSIHRDISLLCEAGIHPSKALEIVIKKY